MHTHWAHTHGTHTHGTHTHGLRSLSFAALLLGLAGLSASCAKDPVDASGTWTINLTNGTNGCELDNWTEGSEGRDVPLTITQSGSAITGDLGGVAGTLADIVFGTHRFTSGAVDGEHIDLHLDGRAGSEGSCAYTSQLDVSGTVHGNTIEGRVVWSYNTNASADCGIKATCETLQSFAGSRPPRP